VGLRDHAPETVPDASTADDPWAKTGWLLTRYWSDVDFEPTVPVGETSSSWVRPKVPRGCGKAVHGMGRDLLADPFSARPQCRGSIGGLRGGLSPRAAHLDDGG
jgi:hypothetical protein